MVWAFEWLTMSCDTGSLTPAGMTSGTETVEPERRHITMSTTVVATLPARIHRSPAFSDSFRTGFFVATPFVCALLLLRLTCARISRWIGAFSESERVERARRERSPLKGQVHLSCGPSETTRLCKHTFRVTRAGNVRQYLRSVEKFPEQQPGKDESKTAQADAQQRSVHTNAADAGRECTGPGGVNNSRRALGGAAHDEGAEYWRRGRHGHNIRRLCGEARSRGRRRR